MKKILALLLSVMTPGLATPLSGNIDSLIRRSTQIEHGGIDTKLDRILDLDVIAHDFNLNRNDDSTYSAPGGFFEDPTAEADSLARLFNTKLKVKRYTNSPEYNARLQILRGTRDSVLKSTYYVVIRQQSFPDYNTKSGTFDIRLGENIYSREAATYFPKMMGRIHFETLPVKLTPFEFLDFKPADVYEEFLTIRTTEEIAAKIEENSEHIELVLFFNFSGKKKITSRLLEIRRQQWYTVTANVPFSRNVRILVRNSKNQMVYYDKTFSRK